jgi:G3E family GTPase
MNHLGISSFVYRASVPFNSQRLLALLNQWPVPIKDELDIGLVVGLGNKEGNLDDETPEDKRAFVGVLRSKGFCWMAPTYWSNARGGPGEDVWRHDTAMYWSHAGKHFGISTAGKWWASLGMEGMRPFFSNNMGEYDRILREDWASEEWGDRRQELVFIGTRLDEDTIRSALNSCLCTEEEMVDYRARLRKYLDANPSTISR